MGPYYGVAEVDTRKLSFHHQYDDQGFLISSQHMFNDAIDGSSSSSSKDSSEEKASGTWSEMRVETPSKIPLLSSVCVYLSLCEKEERPEAGSKSKSTLAVPSAHFYSSSLSLSLSTPNSNLHINRSCTTNGIRNAKCIPNHFFLLFLSAVLYSFHSIYSLFPMPNLAPSDLQMFSSTLLVTYHRFHYYSLSPVIIHSEREEVSEDFLFHKKELLDWKEGHGLRESLKRRNAKNKK